MVFMREEHECPEENLRKKAQVTLKEFLEFLSLALKLFQLPRESMYEKLYWREAQLLISMVCDRSTCNQRIKISKKIQATEILQHCKSKSWMREQ